MGESMIHNIICLVIGYFCGCISSGYFVGKFHHIDIREHGSGNAGTTNVLRGLVKMPALITFVGDLAKAVLPILVIRVFLSPDNWYLLCLYIGLGVVLGHNYPFYMGFKGGKGIAATAGLLVAMDLRVTAVCLIVFILIVAVTRYVSLGSLVVVTLFLIGMVFFGSHGAYGLGNQYLMEFYLVSAAVTLMAFWRHRSNIGRLLHGTENKIGSKKK